MFGTADPVTREQMAVMMQGYANYKNGDTGKKGDFSGLDDGASV